MTKLIFRQPNRRDILSQKAQTSPTRSYRVGCGWDRIPTPIRTLTTKLVVINQ